jgi:ribonuclease HI
LLPNGHKPKELSGGEEKTTNNRMELTAAIEALSALTKSHQIEVFTGSKYLERGIKEWLPRCQNRNWQTTENTPVKNQDLWEALSVKIKHHDVKWRWLRGHDANKWNERADALARSAVQKVSLPLKDNKSIHIFTAISFKKKTNRGGWSVIFRFKNNMKVICGDVPHTTGNRMHLQAAIEGLAAIKRPLPISLYTYSGYLKDGATNWVKHWSKRNWQTKEGNPVRHRDLWVKLCSFAQKYEIQWHVVSKTKPPCEMQEAKLLARETLHEQQQKE